MSAILRPVLALLWKDILLELRTKDIVVSVLLFSLIVIVVFNFAIDPTPERIAVIAPGILWVAFVFGGVVGLTRSLALEKDQGNLQGLMLAPVGRDAIYFGKTLGVLVFMFIVEAITFPVFAVLFNLPLAVPELVPHFGQVAPVVREVERIFLDEDAARTQVQALTEVAARFCHRRFAEDAPREVLDCL